MKVILFTGKGDKVLLETDVVEEAEKILKEHEAKGCGISEWPKEGQLPDEILVWWPMSGGIRLIQ